MCALKCAHSGITPDTNEEDHFVQYRMVFIEKSRAVVLFQGMSNWLTLRVFLFHLIPFF